MKSEGCHDFMDLIFHIDGNKKVELNQINGLCYKENGNWQNNVLKPCDMNDLPIPCTVFYEEMLAQNRIVNHDIYSFDGAHAVHVPKNMSPDELTHAYWELYKKVFSLYSIFKRTIFRREFIKSPMKYLFCLYVNLYYRWQINKEITPNII